MHRIHASAAIAGLAALFLGLATAPAVAQEPPTNTHGTQPDNTKVNRPSGINADTQKNDKRDLTITQDIRKAIMADKSLSTYAHNVKVITENGNVTLKGPVRSEDERKTVTAKAIDVAGRDHVANELTVAPEK